MQLQVDMERWGRIINTIQLALNWMARQKQDMSNEGETGGGPECISQVTTTWRWSRNKQIKVLALHWQQIIITNLGAGALFEYQFVFPFQIHHRDAQSEQSNKVRDIEWGRREGAALELVIRYWFDNSVEEALKWKAKDYHSWIINKLVCLGMRWSGLSFI